MSEKRIVEINGVKIEVDLRTVKKVECFKVGDNVKILVKEYSDYKAYPGVIIGFDEFPTRPTIIIAYLCMSYNEAGIKIAYLNSESKDIELSLSDPLDIPFDKKRVIDLMDREILQKEEEVRSLKSKKEYFLANFNSYFKKVEIKGVSIE